MIRYIDRIADGSPQAAEFIADIRVPYVGHCRGAFRRRYRRISEICVACRDDNSLGFFIGACGILQTMVLYPVCRTLSDIPLCADTAAGDGRGCTGYRDTADAFRLLHGCAYSSDTAHCRRQRSTYDLIRGICRFYDPVLCGNTAPQKRKTLGFLLQNKTRTDRIIIYMIRRLKDGTTTVDRTQAAADL